MMMRKIADRIYGMRFHVPNHVKSCLSLVPINSFSIYKVVKTSPMLISVFFVRLECSCMKMRADKGGDTSRKGDVLGSVLCGLAASHTCKDGVTWGRGWLVRSCSPTI